MGSFQPHARAHVQTNKRESGTWRAFIERDQRSCHAATCPSKAVRTWSAWREAAKVDGTVDEESTRPSLYIFATYRTPRGVGWCLDVSESLLGREGHTITNN